MKAENMLTDVTHGTGSWFQRNGGSLIIIAGILVIWEIYSEFFNPRGDVYFPSISYVINQSFEFSDMLSEAVIQTFSAVIIGYPIGVLIGVVLGTIIAESYIIRQTSLSLIVFVHSLPVAILAPLFIIWFGTGLQAVSLFVAVTTYFVVMINTITGFNSIEREHIYLEDALGASALQKIYKVRFWVALPHILAGAKIGVQQAVVGVIVIEFIASGQGLGNLIVLASDTLRDGLMFGTLIIIMVFAMILYKFVEWLMNRLFPQINP